MSRTPEEPLGNRIEQVRTRVGMSRRELANRVGVHYQTIGYLERGEYNPSLVLAFRISQVLGEPLDALFYLPEENK
jgi:DNA-binding XRE family transcriptional regulator